MFWKGGGAGNSLTVWNRPANFVSKSLTMRLIDVVWFICGCRFIAEVVLVGGGGGVAEGA